MVIHEVVASKQHKW